MVEGWISCTKCGHRYGAHFSQCSKCGQARNFRSDGKGNTKKIGIGVGIALAAVFIIMIVIVYNSSSAVTTNIQTTTPPPTTTPTGIVQFYPFKAGSLYQISFGFVDKDFSAVASNARIDFQIRGYDIGDSQYWFNGDITAGTKVYTQSFDIQTADFRTYENTLGGQSFVYLWLIDGKELDGLEDYDMVRAFIKATLPDGRVFETTEAVF